MQIAKKKVKKPKKLIPKKKFLRKMKSSFTVEEWEKWRAHQKGLKG